MAVQGGLNRMSRLKAALLCAVAAPLLATQASAQITGHPIEFSAGAGLAHYDVRAFTHDAPAFGGSLGWRFAPWLSFEGAGLYSSSKRDSGTAAELKRSFYWAGADLRWNLRPADSHAVPFILTGVGYGKSHHEELNSQDLDP